MSKQTLYIFTDGNCKNNGKAKSSGGYSVEFKCFPFDIDTWYSEFNITKRLEVKLCTNNKCELSAINYATTVVRDHLDKFQNYNIILVTDSEYSLKCVTVWYKKWETNGYLGAGKKPVKNQELIKNIVSNLKNIVVEFKHINSHTTAPKDVDSIEYFLWNGNNSVDLNIEKIL
jgi:ribonuclease HI